MMSEFNSLKSSAEALKQVSEVLESHKKICLDSFKTIEGNLEGDDKSTFQEFVKESNELLENSSKVDFNDAMNLINKMKEKYGNGTSKK